MQRVRCNRTLDFSNLEPVLSIISSFLGNDAITLRFVCQLTRNVRATLECEKASRIPPNLEKFMAFQILPSTVFSNLFHLRKLRVHGRVELSTSAFRSALLHAPLEEFTCSILLQADMAMDDFVAFLLQKPLSVLQIDECVTDALTLLIGAHKTLRKLAISLDGNPAALHRIAKCSSLREVRLEVPETYPQHAFAPFSDLPLTILELNGCCSFDGVQKSLLEMTAISFNENEVVDLSLLNETKLKKLQLWCERAVGELSVPSLEWLVIKVRDSWMTLPTFPNLQVLAVNTLFAEDIENIATQSPLLKVFEFVLHYETTEEYVRTLVALSNLKLEYLGVYCERQIRLQGIKNVCHNLKVLVLDGDQEVTSSLRKRAAKKNIYFENSDLIMNYAYPRHNLF